MAPDDPYWRYTPKPPSKKQAELVMWGLIGQVVFLVACFGFLFYKVLTLG